jgi:signal transduction histidine kinase
MNAINRKSGSLTNVPLTFLLVMAVLLIALGWLGWLLLEQDHSLQQQRNRDRIEAAAETLSEALSIRIGEEFSRLKPMRIRVENLPGLSVRFSEGSFEAVPREGLLYSPLQNPVEVTQEGLSRADRLEFRQRKPAEAISVLEQLVTSQEPAIQAAARLRLGRISNRAGNVMRALDEYARLAHFEDQLVENVPARWLARYARIKIFAEQEDEEAFLDEIVKLSALLMQGGSGVSKPTYLFYVQEVNRWVKETSTLQPKVMLPESHGVSDAVGDLYLNWQERRQGRGSPEGMQIAGQGTESLLTMWYSYEQGMVGRVIGFDILHKSGLLKATSDLQVQGLGWSITDAGGREILTADDPPIAAVSSKRLAIGNSYFTVHAYETTGLIPIAEDIQRRQLLLAGLAIALLVILTSTYSISRALRKETETAALQVDFVSAVSHEFRTPLTSIRQLIELLASGRIQEQDKIDDYYRILEKESARLQRMVEDLLDFRRMEGNAKPYRPENVAVETLLAEVSNTFREEYGLDAESLKSKVLGKAYVHIDRESLTRSIWNLLDNAVKYSEAKPQITLSSDIKGSSVLIKVKDCGVGIAKEDQARIFRKFVRGEAAKVTNANGTGLGLAIIRKAIEDQGGSIQVQSVPGQGSTFTIVLEQVNPA